MSTAVEFGEKPAADAYRDEFPEHICPVDDDRRFKTVHFTSDTPEWLLDQARAQADEGRAAREDTVGQADLTDAESDRIDFSDGRANVPWARSIKALAEQYGVSDWTAHLDPTLTVSEHRQVMREAGQEGGGARDDGDQRDAERERRAAATEQKEGCNHARGKCEHGKPGACEFLKTACGYDDDEVSQLLATTDGGTIDNEGEIGGKAGGALSRLWSGYKGGVATFSESIAEAAEAWDHAQQAAQAINEIRGNFEQESIHFDALEEGQADLLDLVRMAAADCAECHADHSEHDHQGDDIEDIREFAATGATETPVGTSDETDRALADREPNRPSPAGDHDPDRPAALRQRRPDRLAVLAEADDDRSGEDRTRQEEHRPDAPILTEKEVAEAKKAARWGERNVRDLPRDRLRAIRGHVTGSAGSPMQMDGGEWELLGDAIADYSIDGVGTPTPEPLDSLLSKVQRAEDATPDPSTPTPPTEDAGPLSSDTRHQPDDSGGLSEFGVEAKKGNDGPSREFRAAQNDGYLRSSETENVENEREGLGEFGARASDTLGLDELSEEPDE